MEVNSQQALALPYSLCPRLTQRSSSTFPAQPGPQQGPSPQLLLAPCHPVAPAPGTRMPWGQAASPALAAGLRERARSCWAHNQSTSLVQLRASSH